MSPRASATHPVIPSAIHSWRIPWTVSQGGRYLARRELSDTLWQHSEPVISTLKVLW